MDLVLKNSICIFLHCNGKLLRKLWKLIIFKELRKSFFLHCIEVLHETNYSKGNGVLKTLHHLETSYIIPFCIYMEYSTRQISSRAKEFFKLDIHKTTPFVISYAYFIPMEFLKLYIIKELHAPFHSVLPWSPLWGKLVKRTWSPWNLLFLAALAVV